MEDGINSVNRKMRIEMKARFIVAAMLLGGMALMAACQKEAQDMIPEVASQKTIMLTTEGYTEPGAQTKTSVLDNTVQWVDKDYVYITDSRRWVNVSGGKAYIDATGLSAPVCGYHGFGSTTSGYGPGGGLTNGNTTTPTVYAQSQYLAKFTGGRQVMPVPMAAYSETLEESITFKHLTAAVKVMLRNSTGSTLYVDEVVVKTNTHRINGNVTLNLTDANLGMAASYSSSSEADRKVKVCLAEALAIPDGNSSYSIQVPILPISGDALTIEVKCHTATNDYLYSKTLSDASDLVTLARNEMLTARLDINPANPTVTNRTVVDLSGLTENYTASDGEILTGTLPKTGTACKISVAAGATVTLKDVSINKDGEWSEFNGGKYKGAGINCQGNATLILEGTNYVRCMDSGLSGIHVPTNCTLIIQGDGALTAYPSYGAGIGSGYKAACGNIIIAGGNITAISNYSAAGIGAGCTACGNITITGGNITVTGSGTGIGSSYDGATCGNITITGGTVSATSTEYDCSGIGSGYGNNGSATCGSIIITGGTVTATGHGTGAGIGCARAHANSTCGTITILGGTVTATKGASATYSIGGHPSYCGTVTIGGVEGAITDSPYIWPAMAKDLSASATANTYMVSAAGYYAFNATVKGNGGLDPLTGLTATTIDPADIAGVSVLWELYGQGRAIKHNGSSYNISYSDGYVYFSTPDSFTPGDACVAIYDSSGNILWSWVIWATPEPSTMTHNTKTFMDRNLGAINVDNCMRGFLFEWGRKDAFSAANGGYDVYPYVPVASSVFTHSNGSASTMAYTVTHPTEWIRPSTGYSWMSSASEYGAKPWSADVKTIYDPCPAGWRIPTKENITGITGLPNTGICGGYDPSETYKGFGNPDKGYYWTASTDDGNDDRAYAFCNDGRDINHWGQDQGYAIRPVRE